MYTHMHTRAHPYTNMGIYIRSFKKKNPTLEKKKEIEENPGMIVHTCDLSTGRPCRWLSEEQP